MVSFWGKRPHFCSGVLEIFHFFLRKPNLKMLRAFRILENAACSQEGAKA
jgi:hypothetical protein